MNQLEARIARLEAREDIGNLLLDYCLAVDERNLDALGELDNQLPPQELLNQAFGPAEGGLIYRAGLDAIDSIERSILLYREELSNPPTQ